MMRAVSRSSRLGKYRKIAEETIPISLAIARSDSPAAPSVASWLRAISVISLVISSRTRSRAVRLAFTPGILAEHRNEPRALLLTHLACGESIALVSDHRTPGASRRSRTERSYRRSAPQVTRSEEHTS